MVDISNKGLEFKIEIDKFDKDHTFNIDKEILKKILTN